MFGSSSCSHNVVSSHLVRIGECSYVFVAGLLYVCIYLVECVYYVELNDFMSFFLFNFYYPYMAFSYQLFFRRLHCHLQNLMIL
jgi:hypothetical protein